MKTTKYYFTNPAYIISLGLLSLLFTLIAAHVVQGTTPAFDKSLLLLMRNPVDADLPYGPQWFQETMRDISALGSNVTIWLLTLAVTLYLFISKKSQRGFDLIAAISIATILTNLLKYGFERPRPELVPHFSSTLSSSFPSSHAMISTIVYLTLALLLAQTTDNKKLKLLYLGVASLLTFLIGISRVYLGVHWPTDILAGWLIGLLFTMLFWALQSGQVTKNNNPTHKSKYTAK